MNTPEIQALGIAMEALQRLAAQRVAKLEDHEADTDREELPT
jgi:hypothetical protein